MGNPSEPSSSSVHFAISTVRVPANPTETESDWNATKLAPEATEDLLEECWEQIDSPNQSPNPLAALLQRHLQRTRHVFRMESPKNSQASFPASDWQHWAWTANALWWTPESNGKPATLNDPAGRQLHGNQTLDLDRVRERSPLAAEALTPAEKDFFDLVSPPAEMVDTAAWRYESLHTLQWALQMQPDLDWPDERCDLASVLRLILSLPHEDLIKHAILRPMEELLQAADVHVCLWWKLAVEGAAGRDIPGGLDPGVIAERVHALTWLLQLSGSVPEEAADMSWDQVGREIERGIVG